MKERLVRFLVITLAAGLVVGGVGLLAKRTENNFQPDSLLNPIKVKVEEAAEKVLGEAVKKLPKAPELEEVSQEESEPIKEPVENIQSQTEVLIETIKDLPQDQLEAIKKQIFKELCESIQCETDASEAE